MMDALKRGFVRAFLVWADLVKRVQMRSDAATRLVLSPGHEKSRWRVGQWKAWRVYERARRDVPAYRDLVAKSGAPRAVPFRGFAPDLSVVPVTDKESYVKKYSIEERCVGGALPPAGVMIDESSGTSGKPNNWVRGKAERDAVARTLQIALRHRFGREPIFVINAFALGPWATGMNVSMGVVDMAILKSTGPDLKKIENTLLQFGPKYRYIVMGYPPFLKALADLDAVPWSQLDVTALFGGEGMSEGMRRYLERRFRKVYGSYGASDLEINLAAESDHTIALRRLLEKNEAVRADLARGGAHAGALPMIFQYNPLDYYMETNEAGELVVTLCRLANVAPKVRYNIHDLGHVVRASEARRVLAKHGVGPDEVPPPESDLPLLFHYGRADQAVAYYGCKITPTDVEAVLFALPGLAPRVNSFAILVSEDERADKRLAIALEAADGTPPDALRIDEIRAPFFEKLREVNQDFRESITMVPAGLEPTIEAHSFGAGPFAGQDVRVKRRYIQARAQG